MQTIKILDVIAQTLYDKKGVNIFVVDMRGISTMADYFVLAEGTVDRHVKALSQTVESALKQLGLEPIRIDGATTSDWIVMDYSDIVIHLMIPEFRERYALEDLWKEGKIVDVNIQTQHAANAGEFSPGRKLSLK